MAEQTRLQIPVSKKMKKNLQKRAEELGFSSPNEIARFLLQSFLGGKINIGLVYPPREEKVETLNEETIARIGKSLKEHEQGDYYELDLKENPDAFKDLLNLD